jgi:hypothetical protein
MIKYILDGILVIVLVVFGVTLQKPTVVSTEAYPPPVQITEQPPLLPTETLAPIPYIAPVTPTPRPTWTITPTFTFPPPYPTER